MTPGRILMLPLAALALIASTPSHCEDAAPSTYETLKKKAADMAPSMPSMPSMPSVSMPEMPSLKMPTMPSISMPDFSQVKDSVAAQFKEFTDQIGATTPALNEMGYEITTFRVQWALNPKAKLRLKSRNLTDSAKIDKAVAMAPPGMIASSIISGAATAKRIQSSLHMGTAIIDVDFAVPPKVRMSFMPSKTDTTTEEKSIEDMDLACSQAFADK